MSEERKLEVYLKYGDLEAKFLGSTNEVVRMIFRFLSEIQPVYETLSRITISVDDDAILKAIEGIMVKTPEGPFVVVPIKKVAGREMVGLHLIRAYLNYRMGLSEKDAISIDEIVRLTGGRPGAVTARLSELVSGGLAERVGRGEYRMTTLGIKTFIDMVLPKIKAKVRSEER